jgi:hypothetical protein
MPPRSKGSSLCASASSTGGARRLHTSTSSPVLTARGKQRTEWRSSSKPELGDAEAAQSNP